MLEQLKTYEFLESVGLLTLASSITTMILTGIVKLILKKTKPSFCTLFRFMMKFLTHQMIFIENSVRSGFLKTNPKVLKFMMLVSVAYISEFVTARNDFVIILTAKSTILKNQNLNFYHSAKTQTVFPFVTTTGKALFLLRKFKNSKRRNGASRSFFL